MIKKLDDGNIMLQMGRGTLYSSVVRNGDSIYGLCFSNNQDELEDGVIFAIDSAKGIAGYLKPLVNMLEEYVNMMDKSTKEYYEFEKQVEVMRLVVDDMWENNQI